LQPIVWTSAPQWMSYSTLLTLEACPRRWALNNAEYAPLWENRGYPQPASMAALEGTIIHLSIQKIMSAFVEQGCASLSSERAVQVLKILGGYSSIIVDSSKVVLCPLERNPRAAPSLDRIRQYLSTRVPELRATIQRIMSRIHLEIPNVESFPSQASLVKRECRQLHFGCHTEVELKAIDLGWRGIADLLTLSESRCEIRDFKTGKVNDDHDFQLYMYALLWWRDHDLNPTGRLANKLVLSYNHADIELPAPNKADLAAVEENIRERTKAALNSIQDNPPKARTSAANCEYCVVRHLCEEYWKWLCQQKFHDSSVTGKQTDIQMIVLGQHGPSSWDGVVEVSSANSTNSPILLHNLYPVREYAYFP